MSTPHDPILLISGAGLPAWIWDDTRRELSDSREARVAARPNQGMKARLSDYVDAAARSAPPGRFAIVAHSSGGVIGAELARLLPDRVGAFLAVSAVIAQPGGSFISAMPPPNRWLLNAVMRLAGTRPPESAIRRGLAEGLNQPATERIIADFTAESPGLYRDRTTPTRFTGPRGFVVTSRDRELRTSLQRKFARRLGGSWEDELATGHLPMIEDPSSLATSITRFLTPLA